MQTTNLAPNARFSLTKKAPGIGAKAGLIMAWLYIMILYAFTIMRASYPSGFTEWLQMTVFFILFSVPLGMLPAVVIGMLSAWLIAFCLERTGDQFSAIWAILIGVGVCFLIALLLAAFYWIVIMGEVPLTSSMSIVDLMGYSLFFGYPSLIYIPTGGFVGYRMYQLRQRHAI
jgi:hypothetical protein